jgi:hypothetical protein
MGSEQALRAIQVAHQARSVAPFTGDEVSPTSEQALAALCQVYRTQRICLFTGAGTSFTEAKHHRTPGWWDLLLETNGEIHPGLEERELKARFAELREQHPQAWDVASALADEAGGEANLLAMMRQALVGRTGRDARYKRLPRAYLDNAATLNAVVAFCSRLRAIRIHPCLVPNRAVRAVLTLNYDWFLEGGATQKYNANPFKPMASLDSKEDPPRLPVYHIHGYVPHGIHREPRHPLVLTAKSYHQAYEPCSFARKTLDLFLGRYTTLFIGISFEDELLMQRLEALARESSTPPHFALIKEGGSDRGLLERLHRSAGVQPILYGDHGQIPTLLGHVYEARLTRKELRVPVESKTGKRIGHHDLSQRDYWALLLFNKP